VAAGEGGSGDADEGGSGDAGADDHLPTAEEGVEGYTPYKGPVSEVVTEFAGGIRSGLSYCGGETIPAARANAEFVAVAGSAKEREGAHGDHEWESVSVDSVGKAGGDD